ncbi:hypothetical protein BC834DRAFT_1028260 [Gloeopeniophorella convolvens]|nr:hypothetical protein BC834DRAFT_1028260 [Gloeopeniophorella convolvens]
MAPFSVASLKERSSNTFGAARNKFSSGAPGATKAKPPPPPPPRRSSAATGSGPSAISLRADGPESSADAAEVDRIDWANLSNEDKQVFFTWLDEFFARYLDLPVPPPRISVGPSKSPTPPTPSPRPSPSLPPRRDVPRASASPGFETSSHTSPPPPPVRRNLPPMLSRELPPKVNLSTRPSGTSNAPPPPRPSPSTRPSYSSTAEDLQMSFPPPTQNGSAAADLAVYMHPSTEWESEWYAGDSPLPPHLQGSPELRFSGAYGFPDGQTRVARGVILFSDLSLCWYSVSAGGAGVTRWARFRPRPEPMSAAALQHASATHGAAVAEFAEHALASGRPVARGECWDIAHEALQAAAARCAPRDAPVLSTSRAHGHLLFCGRPGAGRWRGGDDRLRAGDVVEWRTVRIGTAQRGGYAILGNPDHTAVLVTDTVPRCAVADGASVSPADIGSLTVVEQSAGVVPKRESYDLAKLQEGEVWVYRPVGMVEYLGSTLSVDIPPGLETFEV